MSSPHIPSWAGKPADDSFELTNLLPEGPAKIKMDGRAHVLLGRSSTDADVTLSSPTASRMHALMVCHKDDGLIYVIDLKSAHGTHIDGQKIQDTKPTALKTGSEIRFGAADGGAKYKVASAPSRKRPAGAHEDEKAPKKATPEGKVKCSHVLIKHKGSRKPTSRRDPNGEIIGKRTKEEAHLLLEGYRRDIEKGEITFGELAKRVSECSSYKEEGDLGSFAFGKMQPKFSEVAFALKKDELSKPVETDSGVHIILRTG
mmetsp:Transcript_577/g.1402  ORF Transcript_577/g.1402 Transcript_577/m.1402 type:complete len:259 (+) Transcript_577:37-813(+)